MIALQQLMRLCLDAPWPDAPAFQQVRRLKGGVRPLGFGVWEVFLSFLFDVFLLFSFFFFTRVLKI